jgi:flagellar basal-body rod protein FlgB
MIAKISIFDALVRRMTWLGQRQQVLAQNIANSDTPDFVPQDLKDGPFGRLLTRRLAGLEPAATHPIRRICTARGATRCAGRTARTSANALKPRPRATPSCYSSS